MAFNWLCSQGWTWTPDLPTTWVRDCRQGPQHPRTSAFSKLSYCIFASWDLGDTSLEERPLKKTTLSLFQFPGVLLLWVWTQWFSSREITFPSPLPLPGPLSFTAAAMGCFHFIIRQFSIVTPSPYLGILCMWREVYFKHLLFSEKLSNTVCELKCF